MKAKDTIIGQEEVMKEGFSSTRLYDPAILRLLEIQSEISFRAGQEEEKKHWVSEIERQVSDAHKAGIKEVVEFINNLIIGIDGCKFEERLDGDKGCIVLDINENQWQSKLKEWKV